MSALIQSESFFTHKDEYFANLRALVAATDEEEAKKQVDSVAEILDLYQEQPLLLDRHLEPSLEILMGCLRNMVTGAGDADDELAGLVGETDAGGAFPFQVRSNPTMRFVFQAVYLLCKTRGYKHVVKLFPHEVADLEPTLRLMLSQDQAEHNTWETRYVLLLWLSILVRVPFDLRTVDSSLSDLTPTAEAAMADDGDDVAHSPLIDSIISTCKGYLSDPGAVRDAAAVCLSRLLTRPDMDTVYLRRFMAWARDQLNFDDDANVFLLTGTFTTLTHIAKHGHRTVLRECLPIVFGRVVAVSGASNASPLVRKLTVKLAQRVGLTYLPPRIVAWRYQRGQRSLLDNLNSESKDGGAGAGAGVGAGADTSANTTHTDAAMGDDDDVDVPSEIEDIVEMLLTGLRDKDTVVRWSAAKGIGRITSRLPQDFADDVVGAVLQLLCPEESDGAWHGGCLALAELARRGLLLPTRLPDVVPVVVTALTYDVRRGLHSVGAHVRDAACYVCWAFARAYAPAVMAPHVVPLAQGMLTVSVFDREINCRRAASAAFQENVGRQGHENFPNGITILTAADYFTLGNRTNAYIEVAPVIAQFETYRYSLIQHLVTVKLRHWDLDIRVVASKALAALTKCEPEHFATSVLRELLPLAMSKELVTRHGATLAIAEVVAALCKLGHTIPDDVQSTVRNLVPKIEKARLYRGRGGEHMREAVCHVIRTLGESPLALTHRLVLRLLDTLDECLRHPHDIIQEAGAKALRALAGSRLASDSAEIADRLPLKHVALLAKPANVAVSRGSALALGVLPRAMLAPNAPVLERVVSALIHGTKLVGKVADRDAETRRNCVVSLAEVVETVGVAWGPTADTGGLSTAQVYRIFCTLLRSTRDYATDKRGDVGSWVRQQAMLSLERVARVLLRLQAGTAEASADSEEPFVLAGAEERAKLLDSDPLGTLQASVESGAPIEFGSSGKQDAPVFTTAMGTALVCALLRQLAEKLDLLRGVAGEVLTRLLHDDVAALASIPACDTLKKLFPLSVSTNDGAAGSDVTSTAAADPVVNWTAPTQCYPVVVKVASIPEYCDAVVEGLVTSVGGMSESVVKHSSNAFVAWAKEQLKLERYRTLQLVASALHKLLLARCVSESSGILPEHAPSAEEASSAGGAGAGAGAGAAATTVPTEKRRVDARVLVPALRTLHALLEAGVLEPLQQPRSDFAAKLLPLVRLRVLKSVKVDRIMSGLDVLIGLLAFKEPVATQAVQVVLELLCHKFPSVRKVAAEKLYVKILTFEDQFASRDGEEVDIDDALEVLTETGWDADEASGLEEKRDEIYTTLKVPVPDRSKLPRPKERANKGGGDNAGQATYADLVKEMHY